MNLSLRSKIIAGVIALGLLLIALFKFGLGGSPISVIDNQPSENQNSNDPALISSEPPQLYIKEPLIVSPNQIFKLNFNIPLQNGPETKITLDPPHEIEIKLTGDSKTAIITPKTPYKLGQGYTMSIKPDTKLKEEGKTLGKDYDMHFNVINYSGI